MDTNNYEIDNELPMPDIDIDNLVAQATYTPSPEEIDKRILDPLNPEQKKAAMIIDGPIRILAGAGTGKTKTVTHRIAYMINHGVNPSSILAITFTNKAAKEFKERLVNLLPTNQALTVNCGTIHGIFARILREYADCIGYNDQYAIVDTDDVEKIIKDIAIEVVYGTSDAKIDKDTLNAIANQIYYIKSDITYRDELDELLGNGDIDSYGYQAYINYQTYLREHNMMDFDDLLLNMYDLLDQNPDVLAQIQEHYTHIIVDEYQDTSYLQDRSIKMIAAKYRNLCVIGDDDQSIYSWRGANPKLMLEFTKAFPETTDIKLEENYRSTSVILDAANQIISHNHVRIGKSLWTQNKDNEQIHFKRCKNSFSQADYVVKQIIDYHKAGIPYKQMAVLYRQNASSGIIENSLAKNSIPYDLYNGTSFFAHKSVKDIVSYAKLLLSSGPETDLALKRIINKPARGFSDAKVADIERGAEMLNQSLIQTVKSIAVSSTESKFKTSCAGFLNLFISSYQMLLNNANIGDIMKELYDKSGYMQWLLDRKSKHTGEKLEDDISDEANVNACIDMAYEFDKLHRGSADQIDMADNSKDLLCMFLEYATLSANTDKPSDADSVQLLTMHKSKGLEFRCVFVIDLCDSVMPSQRDEDVNHEEERRLMYVTVTRAKKHLHLISPYEHRIYGKISNVNPSPFISEINSKLLTYN